MILFDHYHLHKHFKFKQPQNTYKRLCKSIGIQDGYIPHRTCTTVAVEGQPTPKPSNAINTLFWKGLFKEAIHYPGIPVDTDTYATLLQVCTDIQTLKQLHAHMLISGVEPNIFIHTKLVSMHAICGSMQHARLVFDKIHKPNVFLWNVMIRGYATNGPCEEALRVYRQMERSGVQPDKFTFPFVLKACAALSALQEGKEIHDRVVRSGFESDVFVGNSLVTMYAKCGLTEVARQVFDKMSKRDVVSWNAMIVGYSQNGYASEAVTLFNQMCLADVTPDPVTVVSVLQACGYLGALEQGKRVRECIIRNGLESDVYVQNSLVDMYTKCGNVEAARQVFDKMSERNVVSWNVMITGYTQNGHANEALTLFKEMQRAELKPDMVTIVSVLPACACLAALQQGKCIHGYIIKNGFDSNVVVGTTLIDTYAKCRSVEIARELFDRMSKRNAVSWSAMIAGYAQNGQADETLTLFNRMQVADMKPDSMTMVSVLPACAHLAALQQGKCIHGYIIRSGYESDVFVGNSLIDMYAKCGSIEVARQSFDTMSKRDVVSWNSMIAGYGMHGKGEDALKIFSQMQQTSMKPNHITFVCVLSACSHAGMVDVGCQYFDCMIQEYRITPKMEHYACVVDLLGRAGHLHKAKNFIENMPLEPGVSVWGALLGACRIHCNIELGEHVAQRLFDLEPENAGCYVLLSNIYAAADRWDDVAKVRTIMKDRGLKKIPGCSFIEVNNRVHAFLVDDRSHPQSEKIYATLAALGGQMKEAGYVPDTNFVLHEVEEEVKENMLCSHSEKLAIAFGLMNSSQGIPIRITKNLRMCGDCHNATKFISKIVGQEIVVRDAYRFHHFQDGVCSCRDYW